jgi:hypothetical protein
VPVAAAALPEVATAWAWMDCERAVGPDDAPLLFAAPLTLKLLGVGDEIAPGNDALVVTASFKKESLMAVNVLPLVLILFVVVELRSTIFLKPS